MSYTTNAVGPPEIEHGQPIPSAKTGGVKAYPLARLAPGDSFVVPKARRGSLSTAIRRQSFKCPGQRFTTRVIEGDLIRVWRIA